MKTQAAENPIQSNPRSRTRWFLTGKDACSHIRFGYAGDEPALADPQTMIIETGQPLLYGDQVEGWCLPEGKLQSDGPLTVIENTNYLAGWFQALVSLENFEETTYKAYTIILDRIGSRSIYRFWNYVPGINRHQSPFLENYQMFSSGRSKAFSKFLGGNITGHYPSASATGSMGNNLTVVFLAGQPQVEHWENPEQTPAYCYPEKYGPRAPSFARASRFHDAGSGEWIFVSGTASIKESETQHIGNFERQLDVTLDNIDLILKQIGMGLTRPSGGAKRHFYAFLRDRQNVDHLRDRLEDITGPDDTYTIAEADICRKDLDVEIELTISRGR